MTSIVFSLFEDSELAKMVTNKLRFEIGEFVLREFPDSETYLQIKSEVQNKNVIIITSMNDPNKKFLPLLFFIAALRDLGATSIGLIAPYLAYMRQDTRFVAGEAITADYFAAILSQKIDWLLTVEPHLHRHKSLTEIYTIPATVVHATNSICTWLKENIKLPLLIGPDQESEQWVSTIAKELGAPFIILEKHRHGDRDVDIVIPNIQEYATLTPILIDDIVSTGKTMLVTVKKLRAHNMQPPVCIAVHGIFAGNSYSELQAAGAKQIVSCNTITHVSNEIDLSDTIVQTLKHIS